MFQAAPSFQAIPGKAAPTLVAEESSQLRAPGALQIGVSRELSRHERRTVRSSFQPRTIREDWLLEVRRCAFLRSTLVLGIRYALISAWFEIERDSAICFSQPKQVEVFGRLAQETRRARMHDPWDPARSVYGRNVTVAIPPSREQKPGKKAKRLNYAETSWRWPLGSYSTMWPATAVAATVRGLAKYI